MDAVNSIFCFLCMHLPQVFGALYWLIIMYMGRIAISGV